MFGGENQTFRKFETVIIAIMLVVAGASMVFVFYVQRAECLGHGTSIPAVHNEIEVSETTERIRFTHEGDSTVGDEDDFDFKNVTVTISQEPTGQIFRAEWTTLEGGSYPIQEGDTATLRTSRIPFDPAADDFLSIDWYGYLGKPAYCDWVPLLPDGRAAESNVHRQNLNGTGSTMESSRAYSAG